MEHSHLNVDACCLFHEASLLIKLGSLCPLFVLLTNTRDFNYKVFVVQLVRNAEPPLHIAHFYGSSGYASITLSIVLLNVQTGVDVFILGVQMSSFVQLLSFSYIALVLNLSSKPSAD